MDVKNPPVINTGPKHFVTLCATSPAEVTGHHNKNAKSVNESRRVLQSVLLALLAAIAVVQAAFFHSQLNSLRDQTTKLTIRTALLQARLDNLLKPARGGRVKRQMTTDPLSASEGVPIVSGSQDFGSGSSNRTTEGLRIYDAWFQSSNNIPHSRRKNRHKKHGTAIRPHHRKSASWVDATNRRRNQGGGSGDHDVNPHFDETSVYRDAYPVGGGRHRGSAVDLPAKNRAKETDLDLLIDQSLDSVRTEAVTRAPASRPSYAASRTSFTSRVSTSSSSSSSQQQQQQYRRPNVKSLDHHKRNHRKKLHRNRSRLNHSRQTSASAVSETTATPQLRSLGISNENKAESVIGPIQDQFHGLLSVHFVGSSTGVDTAGDGVYRNWEMARWAKRMRLDQNFALEVQSGTVTVGQAGVYYIYAQVNYLDENDVNAFQVTLNGEAQFLCTTMTHTGQITVSKANTCYTGGVAYMEAGDTVAVRDLEPSRKSVIRPAHTFFGMVQLSGLDA